MALPTHLRYTEAHTWVRLDPDGTAVVGITDHAQEELGDVVFAGEVKPGTRLAAGDRAAVVESVKAASDIQLPVAGEVLAFNEALEADPAQLNERPWDTWILRFRPDDATSLSRLMDAVAYAAVGGS